MPTLFLRRMQHCNIRWYGTTFFLFVWVCFMPGIPLHRHIRNQRTLKHIHLQLTMLQEQLWEGLAFKITWRNICTERGSFKWPCFKRSSTLFDCSCNAAWRNDRNLSVYEYGISLWYLILSKSWVTLWGQENVLN